jgi:hypothetical protein
VERQSSDNPGRGSQNNQENAHIVHPKSVRFQFVYSTVHRAVKLPVTEDGWFWKMQLYAVVNFLY